MGVKSTIMLISAAVLTAVNTSIHAQNAEWQAALDGFLNDLALKGASVGFVALETGGAVNYEAVHQPETVLLPASSQKALTCATALEVLSPKYRFSTKLAYRGTITDGVLQGDLFIVGGGDPALGSIRFPAQYEGFLAQWGQAIQDAGIQRVEGTIIVDQDFFDTEVVAGSTAVADAGNYYAGGAHALNYKDNRYTITFSSSDKDGGLTQVRSTQPAVGLLKLKNEVRASNINTDNAYIYAIPGEHHHVIRGTIPKGQDAFTIKGAIPQPGLVLATELEEWLEEAGVTLKESPTTKNRVRDLRRFDGMAMELANVQSPKLAELVKVTLHDSDNSYADNLLKVLGKKVYGEGSYAKGALAVADHWETRLRYPEGMLLADGSGLSRLNGLSASHLAEVCALLDPEVRDAFEAGLKPVGGNTRIQAKSGTISRVKSYTGYFTTAGGTQYAFSFIVNNFSGASADMRKRMDRLLDALTRL